MILCCDIVMILILRPGEVRGGEDTPDGGHQRARGERDTPETRDIYTRDLELQDK